MINNPYARYRTNAVETASPVQLVLMAYQGVIRFTQRGLHGLAQRDVEAAHNGFVRAQEIITELIGSLDREAGGEVSANLFAIYDYAQRRLIQANCRKSATPAEEVIRLFRELLPAWQALAERPELAGARTATRSVGMLA